MRTTPLAQWREQASQFDASENFWESRWMTQLLRKLLLVWSARADGFMLTRGKSQTKPGPHLLISDYALDHEIPFSVDAVSCL